MATQGSFPTREKTKKRKARQRVSSTTFIQRSRNESSEQKAMWHHVTGAGRSHVKREFFGLTDDEQQKNKAVLEGEIAKRLQAIQA
jgi:hypothetical protein